MKTLFNNVFAALILVFGIGLLHSPLEYHCGHKNRLSGETEKIFMKEVGGNAVETMDVRLVQMDVKNIFHQEQELIQ